MIFPTISTGSLYTAKGDDGSDFTRDCNYSSFPECQVRHQIYVWNGHATIHWRMHHEKGIKKMSNEAEKQDGLLRRYPDAS